MNTDLLIYTAASFGRREQLKAFVGLLPSNIICVCQWLSDEREMGDLSDLGKYAWAQIDAREVRIADVLVYWSDDEPIRGGKAVELGMALAVGKPCIIIGRREHVFASHKLINQVDDESSAILELKGLQHKLRGLYEDTERR